MVLFHKIRSVMGKRESTYQLGSFIEMDETFFGWKEEGKWGMDSENKEDVAVTLQLDVIGWFYFLKM